MGIESAKACCSTPAIRKPLSPLSLNARLLDRPELFVRTLSEKLLTYALGRGLEPTDAPAVRQIVRDSKKEGYCFSALIEGIVNSTPFRMRMSR